MAIQNVSGMPYQQYVTRTVLDPLQLRSVQFDKPGLGGMQRAARYSWYHLMDLHELTDVPQRVPDWDYSHHMAGGGRIANVDDLLTFGRAIRDPGVPDARFCCAGLDSPFNPRSRVADELWLVPTSQSASPDYRRFERWRASRTDRMEGRRPRHRGTGRQLGDEALGAAN